MQDKNNENKKYYNCETPIDEEGEILFNDNRQVDSVDIPIYEDSKDSNEKLILSFCDNGFILDGEEPIKNPTILVLGGEQVDEQGNDLGYEIKDILEIDNQDLYEKAKVGIEMFDVAKMYALGNMDKEEAKDLNTSVLFASDLRRAIHKLKDKKEQGMIDTHDLLEELSLYQ